MEIRPEEENVKEISMPQHRMKVKKKTSFYIQGGHQWPGSLGKPSEPEWMTISPAVLGH